MGNRDRRERGAQSAQPLGAIAYAVVSLVALLIALLVGWYLLTRNDLSASGLAASRAYYVLLVVLGAAVAAFLFGVLRSAARATGTQFGYRVDLSGPTVAAVLVVLGGYYLTNRSDDFTLFVRLKAEAPISDVADTKVAIDFDKREDSHKFSSDGQAVFAGVPDRFKGQSVSLEFSSPKYRLVDPKSAYMIPENELIILKVQKITDFPKTKASDTCEGSPVVQLRAFGWATFDKHNLEAAERIANSLERCDNKDYFAYNLLGAVAFYRGLFDNAAGEFSKAAALAPANMPDLKNNLGDALVEEALRSPKALRKQRLAEAVSNYEAAYEHGDVSEYKLARALLFSGDVNLALRHAKLVSTQYDYDGGAGKARILEGAIYLQSIASSAQERDSLLAMAKAAFIEGYSADPDFWRGVFIEHRANAAESFEEIRSIYGSNAASWMRTEE